MAKIRIQIIQLHHDEGASHHSYQSTNKRDRGHYRNSRRAKSKQALAN